MKLNGPLEQQYKETLDGVHDLVISLETYRISKEIAEIREQANRLTLNADLDRPFSDSNFMEAVSLDMQADAMEERIVELTQQIRQKIYS